MAALLSVDKLNKTYQKKFKALSDVSLDVMHGEFIALLGPSGCGKTTLLATLAGFLTPDSGRIHIDGKDITDVPPHKRTLNTVFQNYALFPHMSVLDNVSYGPLRTGAGKAEARTRAQEALEMVGLSQMAARYPADMSGGQRQRVALARAIVNRPKLLLLDEPLSALDMKLRKRMQRELKALQEKLAISFIFVTHDQEEAMAMADRIVVMNQGAIEQIGTGDEIYKRPASRFVADFIGDANLLDCHYASGQLRLTCCDMPLRQADAYDKRGLVAMFRPEDIEVRRSDDAHTMGTRQARVLDVVSIGSYTTIYLQLNDAHVEVRRIGANDLSLRKGDLVNVRFPAERVHFVEA
ncbi:MAG: ABC transporter ATP-binding protein [Pollutimonas bauzanensis]|uniref:Spermidine/putrescine import ATP-binding protein PotA n=1 Tax=Pollutimonas bauzanensis TaxID=658167 RepID=A0A1M5ZXP3_9BURK|nr:ABC transporter ATP-binding protein [Pollutimonas bauzanensis]SHI28926.1 spermidine/putrescine transport system ATP-binding protein [Pollutimonas bauzanensis]